MGYYFGLYTNAPCPRVSCRLYAPCDPEGIEEGQGPCSPFPSQQLGVLLILIAGVRRTIHILHLQFDSCLLNEEENLSMVRSEISLDFEKP